jgi:glutathione S-transferase
MSMAWVELVAVLAALQLLFFGVQSAKARAAAGLKAPAMVGDERFERMHRVQMNTIEMLMMFYPALYLASLHWQASVIAPMGAVYLLGRMIYWLSYMRDPATRTLGFALSLSPTVILMGLALVGSLQAILA